MSRPHVSPKTSIGVPQSSNLSDDRLDCGGGALSFVGRSHNATGARTRRSTMANLVYSAIASLDGYVADEDGNFDWAAPDEEAHAFLNDPRRRPRTHPP